MTSIASEYNTDIFLSLWRLVKAAPVAIIKAVYASHLKAQAERELALMDDTTLADIGVARSDIHNKVWGIR